MERQIFHAAPSGGADGAIIYDFLFMAPRGGVMPGNSGRRSYGFAGRCGINDGIRGKAATKTGYWRCEQARLSNGAIGKGPACTHASALKKLRSIRDMYPMRANLCIFSHAGPLRHCRRKKRQKKPIFAIWPARGAKSRANVYTKPLLCYDLTEKNGTDILVTDIFCIQFIKGFRTHYLVFFGRISGRSHPLYSLMSVLRIFCFLVFTF